MLNIVAMTYTKGNTWLLLSAMAIGPFVIAVEMTPKKVV